jgi:hypothetical protein
MTQVTKSAGSQADLLTPEYEAQIRSSINPEYAVLLGEIDRLREDVDRITKIARADIRRAARFEEKLDKALSAQRAKNPDAWMYALEYGSIVADKRLSVDRLRYPFGVCGADYLAENDSGVSYVREQPLFSAANPLTDEQIKDAARWRKLCDTPAHVQPQPLYKWLWERPCGSETLENMVDRMLRGEVILGGKEK